MKYPYYIAEFYKGKFNTLDGDVEGRPLEYPMLVDAKRALKATDSWHAKHNDWTYKIMTLLEVE